MRRTGPTSCGSTRCSTTARRSRSRRATATAEPAWSGRPLGCSLVPSPERTLVLVKPDGVQRGLVGEIIGRIERKGLRIAALELRTLDRSTAEQHYGEHEGK